MLDRMISKGISWKMGFFYRFLSWKQSQGCHVSDITKRRCQAWIAAEFYHFILLHTFITLQDYSCVFMFSKGIPIFSVSGQFSNRQRESTYSTLIDS